jgi:hypothetical protein
MEQMYKLSLVAENMVKRRLLLERLENNGKSWFQAGKQGD